MKRFLIATLTVLALYFAGRALVRALVSDETKIRWLIEDMADGFNGTRMNPVLEGLAADYLDETSGADREMVRQALVHLFFTAKDETTKRFRYRVELSTPGVKIIETVPDLWKAECDIEARFFERHGKDETVAWQVQIAAKLERGQDGWRFTRTSYHTESGAMPR